MQGNGRSILFLFLLAPLLLSDGVENADAEDSTGAVPSHSAFELAQAIRGCRGPHAVFLSTMPLTGNGAGSEEEAFAAFYKAAKMFAGVACFSRASCSVSPDICADHNARRLPAVIVYPPSTGPAQIIGPGSTGNIEAQDIAAAIVRPVAAADRAAVLTSENFESFLQNSKLHTQVLLFSSRKTTPLILQALSSDAELWMHCRFGFVKHTETTLVAKFKVKEVPQIMIRAPAEAGSAHDSSQSGWEAYGGSEMTVNALRTWIKDKIDASTVDPGEDGLFQAVEGASLLEDDSLAQIDLDDPDEEEDGSGRAAVGSDEDSSSSPPRKPGKPRAGSRKPGSRAAERQQEARRKPGSRAEGTAERQVSKRYKKLKPGAEGCAPGHEITNLEECMRAMDELGLRSQPPWVASYDGLPRFCSIRERPSSDTGSERLHFNGAESGQGRADLSPVCKVSPSTGPPGGSDELVPQLNAGSKEELLDTTGFCLVYLREGPISTEESSMLVDLSEQFRPQLQHQGTKMSFMWMDLHTERKFKAHFDPPALPSAVVLNPHKRPRYAMVRHSEDSEGEPMPIDQSAMALLLNTVLGGDAHFSPLPSKLLTQFSQSPA